MNTVIEEAEKSNCHLHITGALRPEVIRSIGKISSVDTLAFEPLEKHLHFDDPNIWAASKEVTSTAIGLSSAILNIAEVEKRTKVTYVEITINPFGMIRRGMLPDQIISVLQKASSEAQKNGVTIKYKFGVNRKDGPESIKDVISVFNACPDYLRVAIDLNGDESKYPTSLYYENFRDLSNKGIPTTIHAGENLNNTESLRLAVIAQPRRVVHALSLVNDPKIIAEINSQGIVIESAPTSNIKRGIINGMKNHPLRMMLEREVKVVLGTDDPAFFGNDMNVEYSRLLEIGLSEDDILCLIKSNNNVCRERI